MGTDAAIAGGVRKVTIAGLVLNLVLSAFKMVAGFMAGSQSVLADGMHSLSDCTTDIALLVGVKYWTAPPDSGHPHGHSRYEAIVSMGIGFVLGLAGIGIGYNAYRTVGNPHPAPGVLALVAALLSIVLKEALYRWTVSEGTKLKSRALIANAWHHRSDGLSSIPVAIAVAAARFNSSLSILDTIGAAIVSIFILQAAWKIMKGALGELSDEGADEHMVDAIRKTTLEVNGVKDVHKIRSRRLGYGFQVDLHVLVDSEMNVRDGHEITDRVKARLVDQLDDVIEVITHLEPYLDRTAG